jgi:hypothetical protein
MFDSGCGILSFALRQDAEFSFIACDSLENFRGYANQDRMAYFEFMDEFLNGTLLELGDGTWRLLATVIQCIGGST